MTTEQRDPAIVVTDDGHVVDVETGEEIVWPREFEGAADKIAWLAQQHDEARAQEKSWAQRKGFVGKLIMAELERLGVHGLTHGDWTASVVAFDRETVNLSMF